MIEINQHPVVSAGVIAEMISRAADRLNDPRVSAECKEKGESHLDNARKALNVALEADSYIGFCFAGFAAVDATDQALFLAGEAAGDLVGDQ